MPTESARPSSHRSISHRSISHQSFSLPSIRAYSPLVASLCAVLLASTSSANAAPRYGRDDPSPPKVTRTDRSTGLKRAETGKQQETRPPLKADDIIALQGEIKHIRYKQIQQYKLLCKAIANGSPDLPDCLFRLADLYAQTQRFWRFRGMEMYRSIDTSTGSAKADLEAKQKKYFRAEKKMLVASLRIYSKLANEPTFKSYPRMDEVLFYYAYTLDGVKRITESRKIFHQLINHYPASKYIPQAHLSFADYFFENDDLDNAEKFYDKVLTFPGSSVYSYALYKKGWVHLNQERPRDAMGSFFKVATITKGNPQAKTLNRAAKKDFVRAYVEEGQVKKAYKAFQRVDQEYALKMLRILGSLYLDRGDGEKAIYVYRQLIGLKSQSPEVCQWQSNVLSAMLSVGSQEQKLAEVITLAKVYAAHKKGGVLKGAALLECRDNAQATASELARVWHNEAVKTMNLSMLESTGGLYRVYLKSFPKAKDASVMAFHHANLLWERAEGERGSAATRRWEEAATAFTDVVHAGRVGKKLVKEAAYAAVLAWKNALDVDPFTPVPDAPDGDGRLPKPRPISEREKKMMAAFDLYIEHVQDQSDDELVMMKFLRIRILWRHEHLKEVIPMLREIVNKHSEHETALYSANILLDSLIRLKRFKEMDEMVVSMLSNTKFIKGKDSLVERLHDNRVTSLRKAAERYQEAGQHLACARAYLAISEEYPSASGMDEVLYNAGVCFEEAQSIGLAIRTFTKLDARFPDSVRNQRALIRMGTLYGAIAHYENAAKKFEDYARRFGGEEDAPGVLQNAVTYRKGIGHDKEAIANIERFVRQYKKRLRSETAAAMFGLAGIYEKQGDTAKVIKAYKRYIQEIGTSGGIDRLLIAHAKVGELLWEQSCKVKGEDGACVKTVRQRATRVTRRSGSTLPIQCGPESKIKLTVIARDKRRVSESRRYLRDAIKLESKAVSAAPDERRRTAAIYWGAAARFYLNGSDYEQFLSIKFPRGLNFSQRNPAKAKDSLRRFTNWMKEKSDLAVRVNHGYEEVRKIRGGGAAWAVAGAARIGQVSQNFADGLFTAQIPRDVRTGPYAEESVAAYCDAVTMKAEPLERLSLDAFGFCLGLSTELNWFNRWSRLCEKELGQIRPASYPTATEFHGRSNAVAAITARQSLILQIAH